MGSLDSSTPENARNTTSAASGSTQMFASATGVTFPITQVAAMSSTSGEAIAYRRARASSTPVSTSRISGRAPAIGRSGGGRLERETDQLRRDLQARESHALRRKCRVVQQDLDREAVDQGADLEAEVVGVVALGELARRAPSPHDVGDRLAPPSVELLALPCEILVSQGANPDLDPERPLVEPL